MVLLAFMELFRTVSISAKVPSDLMVRRRMAEFRGPQKDRTAKREQRKNRSSLQKSGRTIVKAWQRGADFLNEERVVRS